MNKGQNQTMKMFQLTSEYLDGIDSAILDGLPGFQGFKTEFNNNRGKLRAQYELQSRTITGYALGKKEIRMDMTDQAVDISNKIVAYATITNNTELIDDMHYTTNGLRKAKDNECIVKCLNIHNKAVSLLTELGDYDVTALMLTTFQTTINKFDSSLVKPQTQINTVKLATAEINSLFNASSQLLNKMDRLVLVLKNTQPDFVKGYFESRALDQAVGRHFSIKITVMNSSNQTIMNALVKNDALGVKRRTTAKGNVFFRNIAEGTHDFIISKSGYVSQTKKIAVTPGERTDVVVVL
jgi:hypothetical protein